MTTSRWTEHKIDVFIETGIDLKHRRIILNDGIDDAAVELIQKGFALLGSGPITIRINSGGGDVYAGLAIIDMIKKHGRITMEVWGQAESMAAVILQAARRRKISKGSHLMIHQGVEQPPEDIKKNVKAYIKLSDAQDHLCDEIVLDRIQEKHPKYSWSKFREETHFDVYFTAEHALRWGLVDEII